MIIGIEATKENLKEMISKHTDKDKNSINNSFEYFDVDKFFKFIEKNFNIGVTNGDECDKYFKHYLTSYLTQMTINMYIYRLMKNETDRTNSYKRFNENLYNAVSNIKCNSSNIGYDTELFNKNIRTATPNLKKLYTRYEKIVDIINSESQFKFVYENIHDFIRKLLIYEYFTIDTIDKNKSAFTVDFTKVLKKDEIYKKISYFLCVKFNKYFLIINSDDNINFEEFDKTTIDIFESFLSIPSLNLLNGD